MKKHDTNGMDARGVWQEQDDVPVAGGMAAWVIVALMVATAMCANAIVMPESVHDGYRADPAIGLEMPTRIGPVRQTLFAVEKPAVDLKRQEAESGLEGYHWVDKARGIARIPIDRAMQIVAAQGGAAISSKLVGRPFRVAGQPAERPSGVAGTPGKGAQR